MFGNLDIEPSISVGAKSPSIKSTTKRPRYSESTPPVGVDFFTVDHFGWKTGYWGPELQILDGKYTFNWLRPWVEREVKQSPVNGHEQAVAAKGSKAADNSFWAHVNVRPKRV